MKMNHLKKIIVSIFVLALLAGLFPAHYAQAATKPAKAKVTAKVNNDGASVTLTIAKTENALGYKIMIKKPGAKKFTKLATVRKDGTVKRTFTVEDLTAGEYRFKVRAYLKNGSKTVWGKYSKVSKVKIETTPADMSGFAGAKTGDIIAFGSYEQDNNTDNGREAIEWIVLSNNGSELFVVSKYALDSKLYHDEYKGATWEECSLRQWLNDEFYNTAFSASDKTKIKAAKLKNDNNPEYGTEGGNETTDKVFLLSLEDVLNPEYGFSSDCSTSDIARRCAPTAYAVAQGAWVTEESWPDKYKTSDGEPTCQWWLRSPGDDTVFAAFVYPEGLVGIKGNYIYGKQVVRPALIIDLNP